MRTLLICHHDAALVHTGLARWLASFSTLAGVVIIDESKKALKTRFHREFKRVGAIRMVDVLAFRLYYRLFCHERDQKWAREKLAELCRDYPPLAKDVPVLRVSSPNSKATRLFVTHAAPDISLACCKVILKKRIFSIPTHGTFIMHPGHCPEYRNAHGCFWALAQNDLNRISMTLLKADAGIDTGPVYGYYSYPYNELKESHYVIQNEVVLRNLAVIAEKLKSIVSGKGRSLEINPAFSAEWGQPQLSRYLFWKRRARRRHRHGINTSLS